MRPRFLRWPAIIAALVLLIVFTPPGAHAQGLPGSTGSASGKPPEEGGGEAPALDLTSPRQTVLSFNKLVQWAGHQKDKEAAEDTSGSGGRADVWGRAARALVLDDVDPADGPRLAQQLAAILDKLGRIKPDWLASADYASKARLHQYTLFPQAHFDWALDQLAPPPTPQASPATITLTLGPDGLWRFSAQTIADLPALASYFAPLKPPDQAHPASRIAAWLGPTFQKTPWWSWGVLLGAIVLALAVGKFIQGVLKSIADRMEKRRWGARASAIHDAVNPVGLGLVALGLQIGLHFIAIPPALHDRFVLLIIKFLYILAVGWFLYNLVDVLEAYLTHLTARTQSKIDDMVIPLVRKSLRLFVVVVFTLVVAQNVFGLDITGWLAGLGIAGLAVSLAAQDSIKNLFGSLTVFFDKPFVVGHFIEFQDYTGTVEEIGFRSTRIRTLDGHLVTVPNMKFIDQNVRNISARPSIRRIMNVTITYDTPPDKVDQAVKLLGEIMHEDEVVQSGRFDMDKFPPRIAFNEMNAASLNLQVYYWYQLDRDPDRGYWTYFEHAGLINRKLFERFGEAGIDFAFPTQTLHLAGDHKRELAVTLRRESDGGSDHSET